MWADGLANITAKYPIIQLGTQSLRDCTAVLDGQVSDAAVGINAMVSADG